MTQFSLRKDEGQANGECQETYRCHDTKGKNSQKNVKEEWVGD